MSEIEKKPLPTSNHRSFLIKKSSLYRLIFFVIFMLVLASLFYWLMNIDHRLLRLMAITHVRQDALQTEIEALQSNAMHEEQLKNDVAVLKATVEKMLEFQQANKNVWALTEAYYFVKLANDNLKYTGNIILALKLLESADQILAGLVDPKLVSVRQLLAEDIAHLQSIPPIDIDGIYARLSALHAEIDQLPLIDQPNKIVSLPPSLATDHRPWWQSGLQSTWETLKTLIVVRYHEKETASLLLPEQKSILYQELHAEVGQAIWALLHGQQTIYLSSLQQIQTWVKQYFVADNAITKTILMQLAHLQGVSIQTSSPTINSLEALAKMQ